MRFTAFKVILSSLIFLLVRVSLDAGEALVGHRIAGRGGSLAVGAGFAFDAGVRAGAHPIGAVVVIGALHALGFMTDGAVGVASAIVVVFAFDAGG